MAKAALGTRRGIGWAFHLSKACEKQKRKRCGSYLAFSSVFCTRFLLLTVSTRVTVRTGTGEGCRTRAMRTYALHGTGPQRPCDACADVSAGKVLPRPLSRGRRARPQHGQRDRRKHATVAPRAFPAFQSHASAWHGCWVDGFPPFSACTFVYAALCRAHFPLQDGAVPWRCGLGFFFGAAASMILRSAMTQKRAIASSTSASCADRQAAAEAAWQRRVERMDPPAWNGRQSLGTLRRVLEVGTVCRALGRSAESCLNAR